MKDYKAYLDFVLAMENRGEPQVFLKNVMIMNNSVTEHGTKADFIFFYRLYNIYFGS